VCVCVCVCVCTPLRTCSLLITRQVIEYLKSGEPPDTKAMPEAFPPSLAILHGP